MQPQNQNPYDFIMNDPPKKKAGLGGFTGKQRIMAMIIGAGVVLIVIMLGLSLVFGGGTNTTEELVSLAQEQTELIRVADVGVEKARTTEGKNLAVTASLSITTSRAKVIEILGKHRRKLKNQQLELKKSAETDKALETAGLNNRFDETFIKVMNDGLKKYQAHLKQIYDMTASSSEKQILSDAFSAAGLLLGEQESQEK